jgi:hypothetical protein
VGRGRRVRAAPGRASRDRAAEDPGHDVADLRPVRAAAVLRAIGLRRCGGSAVGRASAGSRRVASLRRIGRRPRARHHRLAVSDAAAGGGVGTRSRRATVRQERRPRWLLLRVRRQHPVALQFPPCPVGDLGDAAAGAGRAPAVADTGCGAWSLRPRPRRPIRPRRFPRSRRYRRRLMAASQVRLAAVPIPKRRVRVSGAGAADGGAGAAGAAARSRAPARQVPGLAPSRLRSGPYPQRQFRRSSPIRRPSLLPYRCQQRDCAAAAAGVVGDAGAAHRRAPARAEVASAPARRHRPPCSMQHRQLGRQAGWRQGDPHRPDRLADRRRLAALRCLPRHIWRSRASVSHHNIDL